MQDFTLPDLGEGLPDADLVQWLVAEGDGVTLNQTPPPGEGAKPVAELPSPHAGRIVRLHAQAGDTVDVGSVIVTFDLQNSGMDAGGPDASEPDASPAAEPESSPANDQPSGTVAHDDLDPAPTDDGPVADVTPAD